MKVQYDPTMAATRNDRGGQVGGTRKKSYSTNSNATLQRGEKKVTHNPKNEDYIRVGGA
jgi:hypothetical protein